MFDGFQKRMERDRPGLGPQPQDGQHILERAMQLGALSAVTARTRLELDIRKDSNWPALVACGYLQEARPGYFYLANPDGSADRPFGLQSPTKVILVLLAAIAVIALLRRFG